jgi:hypothetical protein
MGFATVLVSTEQGLSEPAINLENESQAGIKADKVKLGPALTCSTATP